MGSVPWAGATALWYGLASGFPGAELKAPPWGIHHPSPLIPLLQAGWRRDENPPQGCGKEKTVQRRPEINPKLMFFIDAGFYVGCAGLNLLESTCHPCCSGRRSQR